MIYSFGMIDHPPSYRFERGAGVDLWTLGFLISGQVQTQTPAGNYLRAGPTLSLTPPNCPYATRCIGDKNWKVLWVIFDPPAHWQPLLRWPTIVKPIGELKIEKPTDVRAIQNTLLEGRDNHLSTRANHQALALNSLERALLLIDEINPLQGRPVRDEHITKALDYIAQNYDKPLNVPMIAGKIHLSSSWFAHLFAAQMDCSVMQYVERYRLDRAAEHLLGTADSIEQIGRSCGFDNPFHFSTRFKKYFGLPPSRYRANPSKK